MNPLFDFFDRYPAIPSGLIVSLLVVWIMRSRRRTTDDSTVQAAGRPIANRIATGLLSLVLYRWSPRDPLTVRDLLRSIAIFGASGSGKTSGSGFQLAKAIVGNPRIGGLILASKPEDREFWQGIFAKAGRMQDLLIFGPESPLRFNLLDFMRESGSDTRDIVQGLMVIGETLNQDGEGRQSEPFWKQQKERMLYNAIEIIRLALGKVAAPDLQRFINGAAKSAAILATPEWRAGFTSQCLKAASQRLRSSVEKHDYDLALDYWLGEYPNMDEKPRTSILADTMGLLHVFGTGIVRELVSTTTNVSPAVMNQGKWVFVDMPISSGGAAAAFIIGGWKYLTQRHILKRHASEETPACVIWADEAQKVMNSFDATYLAECRSHRGCMVYLTQSIHSYYSRIQGRAGEHETDSLLTNFFHKVFHALGDDKTAAYASKLIGKRLTMHYGGSMPSHENTTAFDEVMGNKSRFSGNFSEHMEEIVQPREFMQNLRTGGEANGLVVDGIVVRSGEPFSNGEAFLKVAFSQQG